MNSRDRDTKSLQDKFKEFFKKNPPGTPAARNELVVSGELERELAAETPLHRRLRALRDVSDKALHQRVQEGGVEKIWRCTRDLLEDGSAETRHAALAALRSLAEGQADQLQVMRTIMFRYLRASQAGAPPEDAAPRFRLLHTLTNNGKNINCFEEEIGELLLEWLPSVAAPAQLVEFLQLIINVIKFNATYLDEHIKHGIVRSACDLCVYSTADDVITTCLSLLEAVLCYSLLPRSSLATFVTALCRTINVSDYCPHSWKLMRHVLGGDAGYAAMQELVVAARSGGDAGLLRGAVFYITSALWSPRRPPALKVSVRAVLPALLKALEGNHAVVTYEVVVSLTACVTHAQQELCEPAWDQVLRLLTRLLQQDKSFDPPNEMIHSKLHSLITTLEQLDDAGQFGGEPEALLDLVDVAGHDRPEKSSMRLITARAAALGGCGGGWTDAALALADKYLRHEPRMAVRTHTLTQLMSFIQRNRYVFGSELVELVGVPVLSACAVDADCGLRAAAARHATALQAAPSADAATDLVDLLEKILNRPFEMYLTDVPIPPDADTSDIKLAVAGLIQLLHDKLLVSPAALPLRCFLVLLDHLAKHYSRPALFQHHPDIRLKIFEMLFGLRANSLNCVGFCYENGVMVSGQSSLRIAPICSPWLVAEPWQVRGQTAGSREAGGAAAGAGSCVVAARRVALLLVEGLSRESDWTVLGAVLRALPALLQARALALGRRAHELDSLAAALCSMISDRSLNLPESIRVPGGGKLLVSEYHGAVLPALAALAPYHSYLEPSTQQRIVRCLLKYGMVLRSPQPYINALTIFTLETRDTMVKMLPEVLLDLSKITDTQSIASPMLEFLSTLTRLPKVFASFVEDQYMSVFAILLPYTNPSRYNHYVVSLAHHVIAAWFLKCRLPYRRNFVKFIIHGLHNYIIMPFEEQLHSRTNHFQQSVNEDSSNRQRSSSLGSRAVHRSSVRQNTGTSASAAFHVELTETCVDLLARYTATPCAAKPRRSDTAAFLFNEGHAVTWLVGHKLVTVTTSGCHQSSLKQPLCDRCAVLCKQHAESISSPLPPLHTPAPPSVDNDSLLQEPPQSQIQVQVNDTESEPSTQSNAPEVKRYSKWSLQHSRSMDTSSSLSISDLHPNSGHTTRQNSSENSKSDPLLEILNHFTQRFERISKEVDSEEATWWRAGGTSGAGGGACACWCSQWAELHVRAPTGDVCWLLRLQNQMNWDYLMECPLQEVAALLNPLRSPSPPPSPRAAPAPHSARGDDSQNMNVESVRARSGSASGRVRAAPGAAAGELQDLYKSSSDTVVANEKKSAQAAMNSQMRMSTQPINIPGSPQRQSSDNSDSNDDLMLILPEGKSRHPVRRSNSSPEMSSWKITVEPDLTEMIHLPSCEPTNPAAATTATHSKKPSKKSDMRVSCEAIPEEMSGTSPLPPPPPHPPLCTFNSDPGTLDEPAAAPPAAASAANKHNQLQKTASDGTVAGRERDDLPPLARSKRSNTISVMSPTRRHRAGAASNLSSGGSSSGGAAPGGGGGGAAGGGVTPAFVFLQLYHNMSTYPMTPPVPGETQNILSPGAERPLKVSGVQHERTIKNLDLLPPVETYKVGVLYVGPGQQDNEVAILRNEYGSVRYADFLRQLGSLVPLGAGEAGGSLGNEQLFLNLETGGKDGQFTYVWHDDIMQVQFHVATAMPNSESDPNCNEKRKYIGNDFVSIVYNDSGADFHIHTIKGQLNFCIVIVEPLEHGMTCVRLKSKDERILREFLPHVGACCVSDHNAPLLARQLALHAALASLIAQSLSHGGLPYASNSLERLRAIKRLRRRLEAERCAAAARQDTPYNDRAQPAAMHDFNDYT